MRVPDLSSSAENAVLPFEYLNRRNSNCINYLNGNKQNQSHFESVQNHIGEEDYLSSTNKILNNALRTNSLDEQFIRSQPFCNNATDEIIKRFSKTPLDLFSKNEDTREFMPEDRRKYGALENRFNEQKDKSIQLVNDKNSNSEIVIKNNLPDDKTISFENVNDEFMFSPTSPLESPRCSGSTLIPRGIINPNYPGFQKFAHTLTDFYIEYTPHEYYDSDTSECDIEMDDCNNTNNNTNNNLIQKDANLPLTKIEYDNNNCIEENNGSLSRDRDLVKSQDNQKQLYLKQAPSLKLVFKCSASTPDLLLKNNEIKTELKDVNHPDLLCGVNAALPTNEMHTNETSAHDTVKEDMSLGLTPVDIIGDFEKEVEREFGLHVAGYKKIITTDEHDNLSASKISDATLSTATELLNPQISSKLQSLCNEYNSCEKKLLSPNTTNSIIKEDGGGGGRGPCTLFNTHKNNMSSQLHKNDSSNDLDKPKYQKSSYDDRQLPPVIFDYKKCQQNQRYSKKLEVATKCQPHNTKRGQCITPKLKDKFNSTALEATKNYEESEISQYQEIVSNKELILRNSRYTKLSSWGQYLENSLKGEQQNNATSIMTPSALELFDAYRIRSDIDIEAFENHFKLATEIEKKRKNDREQIRKRLAMEVEPNRSENKGEHNRKSKIKSHFFEDFDLLRSSDNSSDTESHSSDSETCPKLSKGVYNSTSMTFSNQFAEKNVPDKRHYPSDLPINDEFSQHGNQMDKCDFFAKQSKLQIEARMALAQATEVARMQMKLEKQKEEISPITEIIRNTLHDVGIDMGSDKRRVSRQMLTEMNVAQLQVVVNNLHSHIETLNENLVKFLVERDDLQTTQDSILVDVEEISRYIVTKEHIESNKNY